MFVKVKRKIVESSKGWRMERDGVSQSLIHSFINNRADCHLKYKELWTPKSAPLYREFGSCMQWLLTECYRLGGMPAEKYCGLLLAKYHKVWVEENPVATTKHCETQNFVEGMAAVVLRQYLKRWDGDFTGRKYTQRNSTVTPVKWHKLEGIFKVLFGASKEIGSIQLRGSFDGVFEDRKEKLWLLETKCLSMIDEEGIQDLLPQDIQVMFYLTAIYLLYGKKPAGVLYNVVRRPGLRQRVKENLPEFLNRIAKDVADSKRQSHYFKRWEMAISWDEVVAWQQKFLIPVLTELWLWDKNKLATYLNSDQLITKYGRCDMFLPLVKKEFSQHFQRKHVFNELVEAI
jgi:hypothetical protein